MATGEQSAPQPRAFLDKASRSTTTPDTIPISVATYNILAQGLIRREAFYPYAEKNVLKAKPRQQAVIKELANSSADIIALQEIDFFDVFSKALDEFGYESIFATEGRRENQHGVAVFFKRDKFNLTEVLKIQLDHPLPEWGIPEPLRKTRNQGVLAALAIKGAGDAVKSTGIIIANTHLYWRPHADYVRLRQTATIMAAYRHFAKTHPYPLIMCGDLNSTPETLVYKALSGTISPSSLKGHFSQHFDVQTSAQESKGELEQEIQDMRDCPPETLLSFFKEPTPILESSYRDYTTLDGSHGVTETGEPPYTTYCLYKGCLDYIFFQKNRIQAQSVLALPPLSDLNCSVALPNKFYPSDHIMLMAQLQISP